MFKDIKKALVISPHPDDETLGVGGTIKRLSREGVEVYVHFISGHLPPLYPKDSFEITMKEATDAMDLLGVAGYSFAKIPATQISKLEVSKLNNILSDYMKTINPDIVFLPFPDRHIDHKTIFDSGMVVTRPVGKKYPKVVVCYETLSETYWNAPHIEPNFTPNFFVDISQTIDIKLSALEIYQSQISGNYSRSKESTKALAVLRGSQNGFNFAESFQLIRFLY